MHNNFILGVVLYVRQVVGEHTLWFITPLQAELVTKKKLQACPEDYSVV